MDFSVRINPLISASISKIPYTFLECNILDLERETTPIIRVFYFRSKGFIVTAFIYIY